MLNEIKLILMRRMTGVNIKKTKFQQEIEDIFLYDIQSVEKLNADKQWVRTHWLKYLKSKITKMDNEICNNIDLKRKLKTKILIEAVGIGIEESKVKIYKIQRQYLFLKKHLIN